MHWLPLEVSAIARYATRANVRFHKHCHNVTEKRSPAIPTMRSRGASPLSCRQGWRGLDGPCERDRGEASQLRRRDVVDRVQGARRRVVQGPFPIFLSEHDMHHTRFLGACGRRGPPYGRGVDAVFLRPQARLGARPFALFPCKQNKSRSLFPAAQSAIVGSATATVL